MYIKNRTTRVKIKIDTTLTEKPFGTMKSEFQNY